MADTLTMEDGLRVRHGVVLVVLNRQGAILAGNRTDTTFWQLPQGGREYNEVLVDAFRELAEETGIRPDEVDEVRVLPDTSLTVLPEEYRKRGFDAQRHTWVVLRYQPDGLPDLARAKDPEFSQLRWCDGDWLLKKVQGFRLEAYARMLDVLALAD